MLVTSRSLAEYRAMFDLDEGALAGRILDCCAGASSFVSEVVDGSADAVAVDPTFAWRRSDLVDEVIAGHDSGNQIIADNDGRFLWDWYGSQERRDDIRRQAARTFLADIAERPHRYIAAQLPHLPFADGSFELVLCSHLLFTWSNVFGADYHEAAMLEMLRVSGGEVRVFPLVVQGTGDPVPFLPDLLRRLEAAGSHVDVREVPYEFQRGANMMLVAAR